MIFRCYVLLLLLLVVWCVWDRYSCDWWDCGVVFFWGWCVWSNVFICLVLILLLWCFLCWLFFVLCWVGWMWLMVVRYVLFLYCEMIVIGGYDLMLWSEGYVGWIVWVMLLWYWVECNGGVCFGLLGCCGIGVCVGIDWFGCLLWWVFWVVIVFGCVCCVIYVWIVVCWVWLVFSDWLWIVISLCWMLCDSGWGVFDWLWDWYLDCCLYCGCWVGCGVVLVSWWVVCVYDWIVWDCWCYLCRCCWDGLCVGCCVLWFSVVLCWDWCWLVVWWGLNGCWKWGWFVWFYCVLVVIVV